jgi:ribosomal protein L31E
MAEESVGRELLDVPLPDMVTSLALGIAKAQRALDLVSVETAKELSEDKIKVIPAITEKITKDSVEFVPAAEVEMSLLAVGLNPTFYQFSESTIEVTMDIKTTATEDEKVKTTTEGHVGFMCWGASIKVETEFNRHFGKEVHGTSKLFVKLTPVPPPPRLMPEVKSVNLTGGSGGGPS